MLRRRRRCCLVRHYDLSGQQTAKRSSGSMLHLKPLGQRWPPRPQEAPLASGEAPRGHCDNDDGRGGDPPSWGQQTAKRSAGSMMQSWPVGQGDPPRPQKAPASGAAPLGHCDTAGDGGCGEGGGTYALSGQHTAKRSSGSILHVWPVGQGDPPRPQWALASGVALFGHSDHDMGGVPALLGHHLGGMHCSGLRGGRL
jgi:hypothetical protein